MNWEWRSRIGRTSNTSSADWPWYASWMARSSGRLGSITISMRAFSLSRTSALNFSTQTQSSPVTCTHPIALANGQFCVKGWKRSPLSVTTLAHWMAIVDPNADPAFAYLGMSPSSRRIGLGPRILKPIPEPQIKRARGKFTFPPGTLFVRDVASARLEFFAVSASLENLGCRIAGIQEPSPKSDEQAKHAPQTAQLVRRLREALAPSPRPLPTKS
jgi:hypothetical protein